MSHHDNAFTATSNAQKSSDATFSGALSFMRRRYSKDLSGTDAVVWGVPFDAATSNRPGARFGPRGIRAASAIMDNDPQYPFGFYVFDELNVVDYGDAAFDYGRPSEIAGEIERQAAEIINSETQPYLLSLGGDHFVTYPLLKAHAEKYGPVDLVQFDAHQDTWDDDGSRVDHGTFVTRAADEGLINPDRSIQIGIRTNAPHDRGVQVVNAMECEEMGVEDIAKLVYERVEGSNCYLTFDIDALDPAFAPGTGTPVAGGLSSSKALTVLAALKNVVFVGSDVVEVAPAYDHADITSIAGASVASMMLQLLAERRRNSGTFHEKDRD